MDYMGKVYEGEASKACLLTLHSDPRFKACISTRKYIEASQQKKITKVLV